MFSLSDNLLRTAAGQFVKSALVLVAATLVLGLAYPALVSALSASGLAGETPAPAVAPQKGAFAPRPAASDYGALPAAGSHLALGNPALKKAVKARVAYWRRLTGSRAPVPADLVTASASGVDPDISLEAALYQVPVVARATGLPAQRLDALVREHARKPALAFSKTELVNVAALNRALEDLKTRPVARRSARQ